MNHVQIIAGTAAILSTLSVFACLMVIPYLYQQMNELHNSVMTEMEEFKITTENTWKDLMMFRSVPHSWKEPVELDSADSLFGAVRQKRQNGGKCQCQQHNKCPAGPPGPIGPAGMDGIAGDPGAPGKPGKERISPQITISPDGCGQCPSGQPGPSGLPGPVGNPGVKGVSAPPSPNVPAKPGTPGPPGDPGTPGKSGAPGTKGSPGRDGQSGKGPPGAKGRPGPEGERGPPGPKGKSADGPATPGAQGPAGTPGPSGKSGTPGSPGSKGPPGAAGNDAQYCPCPNRSRPAPKKWANS